MKHLTPVAALAACLLIGAAPAPGSTAMTCASPIKKGESAASLKARFGAQAKVMTVYGPEGMELRAVVIWPNDPKRRIEVIYDDDDRALRKARSVRIVDDKSRWRVAGVGMGSGLADIARANGRVFGVSGFGWDYGGSVDPRGGKLQNLPGGCGLGLVMDASDGAPDGVYGDGVNMSSGDAKLNAARPRVVLMNLYWPGK